VAIIVIIKMCAQLNTALLHFGVDWKRRNSKCRPCELQEWKLQDRKLRDQMQEWEALDYLAGWPITVTQIIPHPTDNLISSSVCGYITDQDHTFFFKRPCRKQVNLRAYWAVSTQFTRRSSQIQRFLTPSVTDELNLKKQILLQAAKRFCFSAIT